MVGHLCNLLQGRSGCIFDRLPVHQLAERPACRCRPDKSESLVSEPNFVEQRQNIFVSVRSCALHFEAYYHFVLFLHYCAGINAAFHSEAPPCASRVLCSYAYARPSAKSPSFEMFSDDLETKPADSLCKAARNRDARTPARLIRNRKISERYIWSGSWSFLHLEGRRWRRRVTMHPLL